MYRRLEGSCCLHFQDQTAQEECCLNLKMMTIVNVGSYLPVDVASRCSRFESVCCYIRHYYILDLTF